MIDVNTAKRVRRIVHRRREAMTLIEIMIVVIIMALIATAVAVAVMPQFEKANIRATTADAQAIRSAVELYLIDHPGQCPTVEDLIDDRVLDASKRTADAWDQPFQIECQGVDVTVVSSGPDLQMGTEDDI
jgi:general secretion pathway protein G